jgi:hypothetical protein
MSSTELSDRERLRDHLRRKLMRLADEGAIRRDEERARRPARIDGSDQPGSALAGI